MAKYLDQLSADVKAAMKAGEKLKVQVLRMVIAGIQQEQHQRGTGDLTDDQEMQVLLRAVKTRKDSVAQATEHGRGDIAEQEAREIAVIEAYLPKQMSAGEVQAKVRELAEEIGYSGPQDTGRFMQAWMGRYKGLADGKAVQAAIRELQAGG